MGMRDSGAHMDGAVDAGDAGRPDTSVDVGPPDVGYDGGRGTATTCEACSTDADCELGSFCAALGSGIAGHACLPTCIPDMPDCPPRFTCVAGFVHTIPDPLCAPVGDRCCVDPDGDLYGTGVGCLGIDCDETSTRATMVHQGVAEACNGVDDNCDGNIDEGDGSVLCPVGAHVATTACTSGACTVATCDVGYADCNHDAADGCERNINTATDCGACDMACSLPHSTAPTCTMGVCGVGTCDPGFGNCDGNAANGCEQALNTLGNCGSCGVPCTLSNATATCATGTCAIGSCDRRWGDCDGNPGNGCEAPLTTNADCGACDVICMPSGGAGTCSTGTCMVSTCRAGFEDCDGNSTNGCETNIHTLSDCGACGVPCTFPNGTASCPAGACSLTGCTAGFGNCNGITSDGCETQTNSLTNCGACGVACAPQHAVGTCSTGTCAISVCSPGWADCNGLAFDGCETNVRTTTDCGGCGVTCGRPGAIADCSTGTCSIGSCLAGRLDCDGMDANGCESSVTALTSCGGCGLICAAPHATTTCATGTCQIASCDAGFGDCTAAAGCETNLTTLANCGGCGVVCSAPNAATTCTGSGVCQFVACNPGFGDCNASPGCETTLNTLTNCGGCGVGCSWPNGIASCATGTCGGTCNTGFGDCNASPGCETALNTTSNCGSCGNVCNPANGVGVCNGGGTCGIASCNAPFFDVDGMAGNGCECMDDTASNACSTGTPVSVAAATNASFTGKIPTSGSSDWYAVTFTTANAGAPHVGFTTNDGTFVLDVFTSCAGASGGAAASCTGTETSSGVVNWDFADSCDPMTSCQSRTVTWPTTIYVRVRRTNAANSCVSYTLTVSA